MLVDALTNELEGRTELDAVNLAAHQLGIRPRQLLAHARASVENLAVQPLLRTEVQSALAHLAEMLLRFGSPVSFCAPDTIWVDITGSSHLHASERDLALEVLAQIKAMGHASRVAVAPGPWLARAFAQHLPPGPMGILQATPAQSARYVGELPIMALPIQQEAVTWFARLGLLTIDNLRNLPPSALAGRLEGQVKAGSVVDVLELIQGRDSGILVPHHPEEAPAEELFWEDPLEASEPLLFVLKGLAGRLSARLEGRGQAAQELLLTLHYDRSIARLAIPEGKIPARRDTASGGTAGAKTAGGDAAGAKTAGGDAAHSKSLSFKLATPLFHAEDLERVMRLRLQRQQLLAPTVGLTLQASSITEAHQSQMALSETTAWRCGVSTNARAMTVLWAELSADIGAESVGRLITQDSHLPEKSSWLQPVSAVERTDTAERKHEAATAVQYRAGNAAPHTQELGDLHPCLRRHDSSSAQAVLEEPYLPQLPTRLLHPAVEIYAPIRKNELWVIGARAYIVHEIRFEQRLESIEWWESNRILRDYFRVWLVQASAHTTNASASSSPWREAAKRKTLNDTSGLEALVYRDRERGKSYLHALFD